jgi:hypothetical protein
MMRHLIIPLTVLLAAVSGRAADLDPYLPEDSEVVINLNVRQIVDSDLFKKNALEAAQEALRGNDQIQDILKDLGFDPFKDLDRLIVAAPVRAENDRGLLIAHGRFDAAKFKAKGEEAAKDNPDNLKIHKVLGGKHILYEVNTPDLDAPFFVALAGRDTILVSPGKDYVVDALKKVGQTEKPTLKNKNFQSLLEKVNDRQSLSVALVKAPAVQDALAKLPGEVKEMVEKIQAVSGGVTLTDEVKLELIVTTKDAAEAKDLTESANASLTLILVALGAFAQNNAKPEVEFLLEVAKGLRVTNKGEAVIIKGRISSDLIEDTLKKKSK